MTESYIHLNKNGLVDAWFEYGYHITGAPHGCTNIWKYSNGARPTDPLIDDRDIDYLHVCDLNEFIDRLIKVRDYGNPTEKQP